MMYFGKKIDGRLYLRTRRGNLIAMELLVQTMKGDGQSWNKFE